MTRHLCLPSTVEDFTYEITRSTLFSGKQFCEQDGGKLGEKGKRIKNEKEAKKPYNPERGIPSYFIVSVFVQNVRT